MPELPEVETIKLGLQKKIVGLTLKNIEVLSPKSFNGNPKLVEGRKVLNIWRRAKILGIDLVPVTLNGVKGITKELYSSPSAQNDNIITLLFHLKMTGQLVYDDGKRFIGGHPTPDMRDSMPNSHTRVIFEFSDKSKLYFNDQRRFGWIKIVNSSSLIDNSLLKNLGPEPLEKDFSWQILKTNLLKHKSMPVKVALMDQSVVAGVGNIYSSEACFNAKIDPRVKVGDLEDKGFKKIHDGVIRVIKNGIKHGGSSRAHFVDAQGHKGYFLDYAFVYGKDKHLCKICGTEIKKITLGGRGTYFCPKCQSE